MTLAAVVFGRYDIMSIFNKNRNISYKNTPAAVQEQICVLLLVTGSLSISGSLLVWRFCRFQLHLGLAVGLFKFSSLKSRDLTVELTIMV